MPIDQTLPFERSLFITTPNAIHLRSRTGSKLLFACKSADGIATARAPADDSSVLAVADSQVIILYDTTREQRTKHKLRGGDVSTSGCVVDASGLTLNTDSTTLAVVLARLPFPLLDYYTQYNRLCILTTYGRPITLFTTSSLTAECRRCITQREHFALSLAFATHHLAAGSKVG